MSSLYAECLIEDCRETCQSCGCESVTKITATSSVEVCILDCNGLRKKPETTTAFLKDCYGNDVLEIEMTESGDCWRAECIGLDCIQPETELFLVTRSELDGVVYSCREKVIV